MREQDEGSRITIGLDLGDRRHRFCALDGKGQVVEEGRLAEQQGIAFADTIAGAMNLKLDADNPADREKLRRAILELVAGRKLPKQKGLG
jgi:hypothetical protein